MSNESTRKAYQAYDEARAAFVTYDKAHFPNGMATDNPAAVWDQWERLFDHFKAAADDLRAAHQAERMGGRV